MRVSLFIEALQSELFNGSIKSRIYTVSWIRKQSPLRLLTSNLLASLSDIYAPDGTFRLSSAWLGMNRSTMCHFQHASKCWSPFPTCNIHIIHTTGFLYISNNLFPQIKAPVADQTSRLLGASLTNSINSSAKKTELLQSLKRLSKVIKKKTLRI